MTDCMIPYTDTSAASGCVPGDLSSLNIDVGTALGIDTASMVSTVPGDLSSSHPK